MMKGDEKSVEDKELEKTESRIRDSARRTAEKAAFRRREGTKETEAEDKAGGGRRIPRRRKEGFFGKEEGSEG